MEGRWWGWPIQVLGLAPAGLAAGAGATDGRGLGYMAIILVHGLKNEGQGAPEPWRGAEDKVVPVELEFLPPPAESVLLEPPLVLLERRLPRPHFPPLEPPPPAPLPPPEPELRPEVRWGAGQRRAHRGRQRWSRPRARWKKRMPGTPW